MKIFFERTGGFAGIRLKGSIDTSALTAVEARRLQKLLKDAGFFDLPSVIKSPESGADRFSYKVTVQTDDKAHTVEAGEAAVPGTMRPFLDFLTRSVKLS